MDILAHVTVFCPHHGLYSVRIMQLPIRIGRHLDNDIILNDYFVGTHHLTIEMISAEGMQLHVSPESCNGIQIGKNEYVPGSQVKCALNGYPTEIKLGHTRLKIRSRWHCVTPQIHISHRRYRIVKTLFLFIFILMARVVEEYLTSASLSEFETALPKTLFMASALYIGWAWAWSILCRLFHEPTHFWKHLYLVCFTVTLYRILQVCLPFISFSIHLPLLTAWSPLVAGMLLTWLVYRHLKQLKPAGHPLILPVCIVLYGVGALLWLQQTHATYHRWIPQLYSTTLYPASMRLTPAVTPEQFLKDTSNKLGGQLNKDMKISEDE